MSEEIRHFLLRHRPAVAVVLIIAVLAVLTIVTLVPRNAEETLPDRAGDPTPGAVPTDGPDGAEGVAGPEGAREAGEGRSAAPTPERPADEATPMAPPVRPEAPWESGEERAGAVPDSGEAGGGEPGRLGELLGPLVGITPPQATTTVLGETTLRLEGERLEWTVLVVENGLTHLALGLLPAGGDPWWTATKVGEHPAAGPFRVHSSVELPGTLVRILASRGGPVEVEVNAYRIGAEGRILVASQRTTATLYRP